MLSKTINKLVNEAVAQDKDAGKIVTNYIQQEQEIRRKINSVAMRKNRIMEEYKGKIAELNRDVIEIQDTCPHLERNYYPDAAGGSDSSTVCDWCGKEL